MHSKPTIKFGIITLLILQALIMFFCPAAFAHTISGAEYFIDIDPGKGQGTAILPTDGSCNSNHEIFNLDIALPELTVGPHYLYIRMKNQEDVWGIARKHLFMVTGDKSIVSAEYFIDTDPGTGKGTAVNDVQFGNAEVAVSFDIDTADMSVGIHSLFIRLKNSEGNWGLKRQYKFEVSEPAIIGKAEFFVDEDPGVGAGTPISAADGTFDQGHESLEELFETTDLNAGEHTLYVRAMDSYQRWGGIVQSDFEILEPLVVTTTPASAIATTTAVSGGNVTYNGSGAAVTARGVCWSTSENPTTDSTGKTSDGTGTGSFTSAITGLTPGTIYHVRAYATNSVGTSYGSDLTFTTATTAPTVTTTAAFSISSSGASSGGNVSADGGTPVTARGVCWSTSANPTMGGANTTTDGTGTGSFTSVITGLTPGTVYHVRAYATNSVGTSYGSDLTFTTPTTPAVTTAVASSVTSTGASSGGIVSADGGAPVIARGVCWSTSANPTTGSAEKTSDGTGTGSFTSAITGLTPGTTYHIRAYATNSVGTSYGRDLTFITSTTVPTVTTTAASSITSTGASSGGNVTTDGGAPVIARGVCWSTSENPTIGGTNTTTDGTGTGSFTSAITGLTPGTTYHVRAYATNNVGTSYGSDLTFTTRAAPAVTTGSAGSITSTSATLNGALNPQGDTATYYFEYGTTSSYGSITGAQNGGTGWINTDVGANIEGLSPKTICHFRLVATNSTGTTDGADSTFTTLAQDISAPNVITGWAAGITDRSAKLNGSINPNGDAATYYFEYGKTISYGSTTTTTDAGSGTGSISVNATLSGLSTGATYHFRLVGMNSAGTTYGKDLTFITGSIVKAIIVAGGGPYPGNNIWDATQMNSAYAFRALLYQGYTKDAIYYLNPNTLYDVDGDGTPDVDGSATNANLENAITSWANDATQLFIYLIGHGGIGTYRIGESEVLSGKNMNDWLDDVQSGKVEHVVMIYDTCHSGSFLPLLIPKSGKHRVLGTSALSGQNSLFSVGGTLSFSYLFWSHMFNGDSFYDAFTYAKDAVSMSYPNRMTPQIDCNGNGIGNEKEDKLLAMEIQLGTGLTAASDLPHIGDISPSQTVQTGGSALLYARDVIALAGISRVWAAITPPEYDNVSDAPVTDLPTIDLTQVNDRYEAHYSDLTAEGTYNIGIFVEDNDGFLSLPVQTVVNVISSLQEPDAPIVTTGSVGSVNKDSAMVNGSVNPNGGSTTYYFEYGGSVDYGSKTSVLNIGAGTTAISVRTALTGLALGANYHYRIVASNSGGTSYGNPQTFKTADGSLVYVHPKDHTCGGNNPCYSTIQDAIDSAGTGALIKVGAGKYEASIKLDASKQLTLSGGWNDGFTEQRGDETIIKAPKVPKGTLTLQDVNIRP